jgi:hypothetical protein
MKKIKTWVFNIVNKSTILTMKKSYQIKIKSTKLHHKNLKTANYITLSVYKREQNLGIQCPF